MTFNLSEKIDTSYYYKTDVKEFIQRETVLIVKLDCGDITTKQFWEKRNKLLGEDLSEDGE